MRAETSATAQAFASPASYTPKHLAERILTSRAALEGERKQVTVLFCDIANSTPLAERVGPERMHALLNGFFELALAEVHRYEGTINQFLGDGFMALFGAPLAHEDDARRAVTAALGRPARAARAAPTPAWAAAPSSRCAWGSTPASSSSARSATTCAWTTRRSATPPTWRPASSRPPPPARS